MLRTSNYFGVRLVQFDLLFLIMKLVFKRNSKAIALRHFIILHSSKWHDDALIEHEIVHLEQQEEHGLFKFVWKYFTSSTFRFTMELDAHTIEVLRGNDINKVAKTFSENYNLDMSAMEAKRFIEINIKKIGEE